MQRTLGKCESMALLDVASWEDFGKIMLKYPSKDSKFKSKQIIPVSRFSFTTGPAILQAMQDQYHLPKKYNLYFCSNYCKIPLVDPNLDVLAAYPMLFISQYKTNKGEEIIHDFWLEVEEEASNPVYSFILPVVLPNGDYLTNFYFISFIPFSESSVIQQIAETFSMDVVDFKLIRMGRNRFFYKDMMDLASALIFKQLYIVANFLPKTIKMVKTVTYMCNEVLSSDKVYTHSLDIIEKYIIPYFSDHLYEVLSPEDMIQFTILISTFQIIHKEIHYNLEMRQNCFNSVVGRSIASHGNDFTILDQYMVLYPRLIAALKTVDPQDPYLLNISLDKNLEGQPIPSILMTPIQRYPRLRIFVKELLQLTPLHYQDRDALNAAMERLNEYVFKSNMQNYRDHSSEDFEEAIKDIQTQILITLRANQIFFSRINVKIGDFEYALLLYSDQIQKIPLKNNGSVYEWFRYPDISVRLISNNQVILSRKGLGFNNQNTYIQFNSSADAEKFTQLVNDVSVQYQRNSEEDVLSLEWIPISDGPLKLQEHCMAYYKDTVYIFGGKDLCGTPTNSFFCYDLQSETWGEFFPHHIKIPSPRYGAAMVSYKDAVYLYGGQGNDGPLNDFWTLVDEGWKKINSPATLPGGPGVRMTVYKNMIILTGSNDMLFHTYTYSVEKGFKQIALKSEIIPPFTSYCLFTFRKSKNKNYVYLLGGVSNDQTFDDVWYLSPDLSMWTKVTLYGLNPPSRIGQASVFYKKHHWIFGGIGNSIPFVLKPDRYWAVFRNEGKVPSWISYASVVATPNDGIWLYGGCTDIGTSNQLYKLIVTDETILEKNDLADIFAM